MGTNKHSYTFQKKVAARSLSNVILYIADTDNNGLVNTYINLAENEQTAANKAGKRTKKQLNTRGAKKSILQKGWATGQAVTTSARRLLKHVQQRSTKKD